MSTLTEPRWCDRHGTYTCCQHPLRQGLVTAIVSGSLFGILVGLYIGIALR